MSSDGTYNYGYDADGNAISRTQIASTYSTQYLTTYTWDYRNRLTDVEYHDNNSVLTEHVHFVYDVFDHLIATEVDTTGDGTYNEIDHWVLDVSPEIPQAGVPGTALAQPVFEFNGDQDLTIRYLQAVDRIFAEEAVTSLTQAGTNSWDLVNNLGSVVYVLDNTGTVIDELVYNGFGIVAYESAPTVDHFAGFTGGHVDANTGLLNEDHRWYDSDMGRWLSEDPDGFSAGDTDLQRYVDNNPAGRVDPTGLQPQSQPNPVIGNPDYPSVVPPGFQPPSPYIPNFPATNPLTGWPSAVPSSFNFGPNEPGAIIGGQMVSGGFMADRFGGGYSFYGTNQPSSPMPGTIIGGEFVVGGWLANRLGGGDTLYAFGSGPPTVSSAPFGGTPSPWLPDGPTDININWDEPGDEWPFGFDGDGGFLPGADINFIIDYKPNGEIPNPPSPIPPPRLGPPNTPPAPGSGMF